MAEQVLAAAKYRTNGDLIGACAALGYLKEGDHVLDPTYGNGIWWKNWHPCYVGDCSGKLTTISGVDFRRLPFGADVFDAAAYDPPYVCTGGRKTSTIKDFLKRYGMHDAPMTPTALQAMMDDGLTEMVRVVKPGGIILMKCADYVWSAKLWLGTHKTLTHALDLQLTVRDRFEMVGNVRAQPGNRTRKCPRCKGTGTDPFPEPCNPDVFMSCRMVGCEHGRIATVQQHARRNLSTLFVFQTPRRRAK